MKLIHIHDDTKFLQGLDDRGLPFISFELDGKLVAEKGDQFGVCCTKSEVASYLALVFNYMARQLNELEKKNDKD